MKTITISRRQVLRGAAGFTLALPFLPSLVPIKAWGQNVVPPPRKYFCSYVTMHGGVADVNWYPADAALTTQKQLLPGHTIRSGPLTATIQNGNAVLSKVLQAPSSLLTPRMIGKINLLRGLDYGWQAGHTPGGHLGHYATGPNFHPAGIITPSSDQMMAYSPSFYSDLTGVRMRSVETGGYWNAQSTSYFFANPATRTGAIQGTNRITNQLQLFNALFGAGVPPADGGTPAQRPLIVDRVVADYKALRDGNQRLSPEDKIRIDDHLARLDELQRSLLAQQAPPVSASCAIPQTTSPNTWANMNSVIAMAFMCGFTRIANVAMMNELFAAQLPPSAPAWSAATWHNNVAHQATQQPVQDGLIVPVWQLYFQQVLDLAQKLDVQDSPGVTLLDNALIYMTSECEEITHQQLSVPVLTIGGAGGNVIGGHYVDYRNLAGTALPQGSQSNPKKNSGLSWNRLHATLLQAMGVPKSEYEQAGGPGFGNLYLAPAYAATQVGGLTAQSGDFLPVIGVGG